MQIFSLLNRPPEIVPFQVFDVGFKRRPIGISSLVSLPYYPYGRTVTNFKDGTRKYGTGTLIGPRHVLTSGHNFFSGKYEDDFDSSEGKKVSRIDFHFHEKINNALYRKSAIATKWSIASNYPEEDSSDDYAILVLNERTQYWHGVRSIEGLERIEGDVSIIGFWRDKNDDDIVGDAFLDKGPIEARDNNHLFYKMDTKSGGSGAGTLLDGFGIIGVHKSSISLRSRGQNLRFNIAVSMNNRRVNEIKNFIRMNP